MPELTRGKRLALSGGVVVVSMMIGVVTAILVEWSIPLPHLAVILVVPATFVFVTFVTSLVGVLYVRRCL